MAISKQRKVEIFNELVEKFKNAESIGFASTKKISVDEFASLRASLREVDSTYTLAKKTLIKRALKEALDIDVEIADLEGQIWIVCSNEDSIAWLSKVNDFMKKANKDEEKVEWSMCVFEGELRDKEETKLIASMPSRETLLGRLVGSMKSPISGMARFFDAAAKELESNGKEKVGELEWKKEEASEETSEEAK